MHVSEKYQIVIENKTLEKSSKMTHPKEEMTLFIHLFSHYLSFLQIEFEIKTYDGTVFSPCFRHKIYNKNFKTFTVLLRRRFFLLFLNAF